MFFNKLRKTIADDSKTVKPIKTSVNHDINKSTTKLKNALINEQGNKNSGLQTALNMLNDNTRRTPTYASVTRSSQHTHTAHQRDMFSLYGAITRKKNQKT